ncbi:hypothetical protein CAEBREN_24024 [Caenorhabditis brenneri]|uniref:Uncharacterized protein n=1 Tax=Caenorhabditis brenneri TaxID=135651 RepID=G0P7P0_CAEBE|nr:hypothetical protein CAEBREN_24024 [Caenorhabditis brenneri]
MTPTVLRQMIFYFFPSQLLTGMNLDEAELTGKEPILGGGLAIMEEILKKGNTRLCKCRFTIKNGQHQMVCG